MIRRRTAATAFVTKVITSHGGSISGFGITADFAPNAVTSPRLIILGNWPNSQDATPPAGTQAVKTFGLQECNVDGTACTSELGNYLAKPGIPASPAGIEQIKGMTYAYDGGHALPDAVGNTNFGTRFKKLVTITTRTGADTVLLYNPNATTTQQAYSTLPSDPVPGGVAFQTFSRSSGRSPPRADGQGGSAAAAHLLLFSTVPECAVPSLAPRAGGDDGG